MKTNKQYIKENYIELSDLANITEYSENKILELVELKIIPNYSYTIEITEKITSPLSDENINIKTEKYFAKSHIEKLNNYKTSDLSPEEIKSTFKKNFIKLLKQHKEKSYSYDSLFNNSEEKIEKLLDEAFETEWKYYCNGIYGICTLNANENDIVEKEVIVKKLIAFNKEFENKILTENNMNELLKLNSEFNKVATLFAPYQRITSSRGKYLDKILAENKMHKEIKNYG